MFPPASRVNISEWLGLAIVPHSDDYISLFVPLFDIPMSLDNVLQRIASINDRFYLPRLNPWEKVFLLP